jgi:hypothetical protein
VKYTVNKNKLFYYSISIFHSLTFIFCLILFFNNIPTMRQYTLQQKLHQTQILRMFRTSNNVCMLFCLLSYQNFVSTAPISLTLFTSLILVQRIWPARSLIWNSVLSRHSVTDTSFTPSNVSAFSLCLLISLAL